MITGEPRDTERVMRGSERGCWKSAFVLLKATRWQPTLQQARFARRVAIICVIQRHPFSFLIANSY